MHRWVFMNTDVTSHCDGTIIISMYYHVITNSTCISEGLYGLAELVFLNYYAGRKSTSPKPLACFTLSNTGQQNACVGARCRSSSQLPNLECKQCDEPHQYYCKNGRMWISNDIPVTTLCEY